MDGIELNRPDVRKKYGIKTKYRALGTNYGMFEEQNENLTMLKAFKIDMLYSSLWWDQTF